MPNAHVDTSDSTSGSTLTRLVGVYDADSTIRGELAYFVGARLGRRHCGLCDITHGLVRERSEWKSCRAELAVPFDTYHLNDQPDDVRRLLNGVGSAVVAETPTGVRLLLGPDDLDRLDGSVDAFADAIRGAVAAEGLTWPND